MEIKFRQVSFPYPGKSQLALTNVSFTIRAGGAVAFVGRNGAGKTTLVKLLVRLYDPDGGAILMNGHNLKTYDLAASRELRKAGWICRQGRRSHEIWRDPNDRRRRVVLNGRDGDDASRYQQARVRKFCKGMMVYEPE